MNQQEATEFILKAKTVAIEMKKKHNVPTSQVATALDVSASMTQLYMDGSVNKATCMSLGAAMGVDDDGSTQVFAFGESARYIGEADEHNIWDFVDSHFKYGNRYALEGGTNIYQCVQEIIEHYADSDSTSSSGGWLSSMFGGGSKTPNYTKLKERTPVFALILTDGTPTGRGISEIKRLIKEHSHLPIFFQFIGIGEANFSKYQNMDNLGGSWANASFLQARELWNMTPEQAYDKMFEAYGKAQVQMPPV